MTAKACAVVPHPDGAPTRILCFDHPVAGAQLVKGTIEAGESPLAAARRELWEETGLVARSGLLLGVSETIAEGEVWHFALLRVAPPVRETWQHHCADDGGHLFHCRWQMLSDPSGFEGRFGLAWEWCRTALAGG